MGVTKRVALLLLCCTASTRARGLSDEIEAKELEPFHYIPQQNLLPIAGVDCALGEAHGVKEETTDAYWESVPINPTLQLQDDSCVEYSQIMTYCCGTQGKVECEAAGHAYSGPDEPCEVLKVNVIAGPLSCTGLINASGLLESCVCPGGELLTLAPAQTPPPSAAPSAVPSAAPSPAPDTPAPSTTTLAEAPSTPVPFIGESSSPLTRMEPGSANPTSAPTDGGQGGSSTRSGSVREASPSIHVLIGMVSFALCAVLAGAI